jgi:hypothetical protein
MAEAMVTEGGRKLLAHIRAKGRNIPLWCEKHGLDRIQVARVINGGAWKQVSVNFAAKVCRAANSEGGSIRAEDFEAATARAARPTRGPTARAPRRPSVAA